MGPRGGETHRQTQPTLRSGGKRKTHNRNVTQKGKVWNNTERWVPSSEEALPGALTLAQGASVQRPIGHKLCLGKQSHPPLPCFWLPHSLPQSLILNSVGCVVTEAPEDLKRALRMVSGSTSAGGLEEEAAFPRRGSSLSFFTEGLSLSRSRMG